jgi:hypothetical protein
LLAGERLREDDRLIDYWIGLEALLSPNNEGELRFRVSLRLASILGKDANDRADIYRDTKASYDLRSATVHGSRGLNEVRIGEVADVTGTRLHSLLLRILVSKTGFDAGQIEEQLLRRQMSELQEDGGD